MDNHIHPPEPGRRKNSTQTISLIVGFLLVVLCLSGLQFPAFAGLHLSVLHSLICGIAGVVLFWSGYKNNKTKDSYLYCLGFGLFFGVSAVAGLILGKPGEPNVASDSLFQSVLPQFHEMGTPDIVLNTVLSVVLLGGALDWWRRHNQRAGIAKRRQQSHKKNLMNQQPIHHH